MASPEPVPLKVDFYTNGDQRSEAAAWLLCRVIEKAYRQGCRLYVHTQTPRQARFFDQLLWTFRDGSFVPHQCVGDGRPVQAPVRIGSGPIERGDATVLVNLAPRVPESPRSLDDFERLIDAAGAGQPGLGEGRQRYRWYQQQGFEPVHHKL